MALENVSSSTTVGEIDRAIKILNKVKSKATTAQEQELANKRINKFNYAKTKLLNVARSAVGKVNSENQKIALARLWQNKDTISLDEINKILESSNLAVANPEMLDNEPKDSLGMKILEGKTGVDYLTVVKTTLATSGVALLAKWGAFSAVKVGLGALFSFNPVIGVCAVVLGSATLIKYARQLFQPEINKIIARQRFKQNLERTENEIPEQSIDMDEFVKEYANKKITEETIDKSETEETIDKSENEEPIKQTSDKTTKTTQEGSEKSETKSDKPENEEPAQPAPAEETAKKTTAGNIFNAYSEEAIYEDFVKVYQSCVKSIARKTNLNKHGIVTPYGHTSYTKYFDKKTAELVKKVSKTDKKTDKNTDKEAKYNELFETAKQLFGEFEKVFINEKANDQASRESYIINTMETAGFNTEEIKKLTGLNIQEKQ